MTVRPYKSKRVCCVCGCEAVGNLRAPDPNQPNIVAITPIIYLRGTGKGQLRNAQAVQVCVTCLVKALTGERVRWSIGEKAGTKLWAALRDSILSRYSGMSEADQA